MRIALAVLGCAFACNAWAQGDYPNRMIRWVLPYSAGSGVDILARQVGAKLAERLGQPVVMDNKAGAGGVIGFEYVARAAPDGYQIMIANNSLLVASAIRQTTYDPVRDFAPVLLMAHSYSVLAVHPSLPVNSVGELVAWTKANPGRLNYASPGIGTFGHLVTELFRLQTGASLVHIPHKSVGAGVLGLVTGDVGFMITAPELTMPNLKTGKVRVLAVAGHRRSPMLPDLPATGELGYRDFDPSGWNGVVVPAAVPRAIVTRLNGEITRVISEAAFRDELLKRGLDPAPGTPEEFGARMKSEFAMWQNVIRTGNIKAE